MARFTTSDGTQIAYDFDDSAPAGLPPVVLQHGFAVSAQLNFGGPGLIDALADGDRQTVAIDARGHGDSDKPEDPALMGEARMAQDTRELLAHLGIERYDLIGYSMGAVVASLLAAGNPGVRRMVIGGVGAAVAEHGGIDQSELPPDLVIAGMSTEDPATLDHPLSQAWRAFADTLDAYRPSLAAQAAAMHAEPIALGTITAATLLVVGNRDGLAKRPEALTAAIPGAELEILDGDHLTVVRNPAFVPAIVDFLAQR